MADNELFRLVSLRQSRPADREPTPRRDPRLRHSGTIEGQAVVAPSDWSGKLRALRDRQQAVVRKIALMESVQRAVLDTSMLERMEVAAPKAPRAEGPRTARRASSAASRPVTPPMADPERFIKNVRQRLGKPAADLFHSLLAGSPGVLHRDIADLGQLLDVAGLIEEANRLCSEIHALEEGGQDGLPTVAGDTTTPVVSAVGWGELIVAKETLVGYEAREVAHIENILPGEKKLRRHDRTTRTEEIHETETIREKETERDSQTTDRYELQSQSQEVINQDFSLSTGVNTSGQYGLTQVDTSLDAAFSQSESQSRSSTLETAREIVNKAVERTFERVRQLRRLTTSEEIRELNRHELSNVSDTATPSAISGIYLWVEKVQEVELRHYGTRMMIEFHVPEPALSLLERSADSARRRRTLPAFDVAPSGIHPGNYLCLAQRYAATDVEPPPTLLAEIGYGWVSRINEEDDQWAEDGFNSTVNIPPGYRPTWLKVAWSGLRGSDENREFNLAFSVAGVSQGIEHTVNTYDGVVLRLRGDSDWPQGVPVSGRVHGAWDGAMYVQVNISCMRTPEALDAWRIRTWQALRAGYEGLERKHRQDEQQQVFQQNLLGSVNALRSAVENRRVERVELQKWAIKSMRGAPQNFNAIEQVGDAQEISPQHADAQAPIVRFFEDSFEWQHMNFFLYPYHWARRESWRTRTAVTAVDTLHQAFLEAGAARVIVPVTPGFEEKVAWFLDPANANLGELQRILDPPGSSPEANADPGFRDLWVEILTQRKSDLARGSGTLSVTGGSSEVRINADSRWRVHDSRDVGREIHIAGDRYDVRRVVDETTFILDRDYAGPDDDRAVYAAGSTRLGLPWRVRVPTTLVILSDNVPSLESL